MLLLQIVDKLLKIERRSNATANIAYHHQIFIRLTKKTFHGCHLTGTSTNKYGFASLQSFTNSDIKTIKMTLQIFTGTQTRQIFPAWRQELRYRPIFIINGSTYVTTFFINLISQSRESTSGSTIKSHFYILINQGITMRLFKSSTFMPVFFIDYRTHLLAQSAIGAFVFINFRIPKSFNINMKFDGLVDTHIPTSIASTTFGFIGYIYHLQVYKIYII